MGKHKKIRKLNNACRPLIQTPNDAARHLAVRKTLRIPPETVLAHLRFAPSGGKESPEAARKRDVDLISIYTFFWLCGYVENGERG
ncbi:MAG: hypothetical protein J2P37_04230 [Ktedonobacteraceae bacterium]|nr:hypothetical protein [Ktedonobacteraceae bacterium]